jgi:hypothetical protein
MNALLDCPTVSAEPAAVAATRRHKLYAETRLVSSLAWDETEAMRCLMATYYEGVSAESFYHDLADKQWTILLRTEERRICGFTTMCLMSATLEGRAFHAIYSGDTIISPAYWGDSALAKAWIAHALHVRQDFPYSEFYWFLIAGGYKTYRYLPVFYREFYPRYDRPMPPAWKRRLDAFAYTAFGDRYRASSGTIELANPTPLRSGVADISAHRAADPHVSFFLSANPGYVNGDELACLVKLDEENLTTAGQRMLQGQ